MLNGLAPACARVRRLASTIRTPNPPLIPARTLTLRAVALVVGCAVAAALSLLVPWSLAFDPQAWVVWGRDALRLTLDTSAGPSWKPLPVLLTTPLAPAGEAAPALWMIVARTGGLLALAGAAALGARLGGRAAGAAAAAVMALSPWWAYNTVLGNSEGMLAAALLWAIVAHLAGRPRATLALATAAALLRPEVWLFLVAYGAWLWRADPAARRPLAAVAVLVPVLWLGPDLIGIGGAIRASRSARGEPSPGSAGLEHVPGLAVLADAATLLSVPAALAALAAAVAGPRTVRVMAAGAALWVAIVALMAQAGYAGNPRYLVAAVALGCVLAGVGAARLGAALAPAWTGAPRVGAAQRGANPAGPGSPRVRAARRGAAPAIGAAARGAAPVIAAALLVAATGAATLGDLRAQEQEVATRADRRAVLPGLIADAGGRDAIVGCARVRTAADMRPLVAWELDLPMIDLDVVPVRPAVVLRWRPHYAGPVEPVMEPARNGYRLLARAPGWEAWAACAG
jgi:hypothetical protein